MQQTPFLCCLVWIECKHMLILTFNQTCSDWYYDKLFVEGSTQRSLINSLQMPPVRLLVHCWLDEKAIWNGHFLHLKNKIFTKQHIHCFCKSILHYTCMCTYNVGEMLWLSEMDISCIKNKICTKQHIHCFLYRYTMCAFILFVGWKGYLKQTFLGSQNLKTRFQQNNTYPLLL